jgi:protein involved in polysaccharide export with SLBB domain
MNDRNTVRGGRFHIQISESYFINRLRLETRLVFALLAGTVLLPSSSFAQGLPSVSQNVTNTSPAPESFTFDQGKRSRDPLPPLPEKVQGSQAERPSKPESTQAIDKKPSAFEEFLQGKGSDTISMAITQFGYNLFQQSPDTFTPVDAIPVGPDYLLGPGDEIRITLWGKVNAEHPTVIDREGKIALPQIGILHLAGLTFSETKSFLETEMSRYYKPSEVKMNVSLGRLRSIRVFIVGNVYRPGSYTLSSFSTLVNALFSAGGPSKIGTLRDIQVKRNGMTVTHFDLYEFLLKGDKTKDIRLMPEDVIFIPPVGPLVGVTGNVNNPAIYELKDRTTVLDIIEMASGLTANAFKGRLQIQRTVDHQFRTLFEGDLIDIGRNPQKNLTLMDGDVMKIYSVAQNRNVAILSGAVVYPGEYAVVAGETRLREIIHKAGGMVYYASKEAELTRVKATEAGPKTERFTIDLSKTMEGDPAHDVFLEVNDYLFFKTVPEWTLYRKVQIGGQVRFPGTYTIQKGETLSSLVERAGGFTDKAYLKGALFSRESVKALQQKQLDDSIDRFEQQLLSQSATTIETALTPEAAMQQKASADQRRALVVKMRAAKAKGRISIQLDQLERFKGSPSDLMLEEGDSLAIPEKPQQVQVIGSVYNQTSFVYDPRSTVSQYLEKAGGMTKEAEDDSLYVLRVDGTALSKRQDRGFWGKSLLASKLDPGDTVVVPEQLERISWLRETKDITQILYQIAVTAGVLIVAF